MGPVSLFSTSRAELFNRELVKIFAISRKLSQAQLIERVSAREGLSRESALLEQIEEQDIDDLFDRDWIIEFRQSMPPMIGLIWGGSIENKRREAG